MKVFFPVIRALSGGDVFIKRLSHALESRNIEVVVEWYNKFYEFMPYLLGFKPLPPDVDIIHAISWNGFAYARHNIPLVVTEFHCVFDPLFMPYKSYSQHLYHQYVIKKYEQKSFERADSVTAISSFTRESLARSVNFSDGKLIYLWVEVDKFKPAEPVAIDPAKPFRLLYVGNVSRRKGFDLLEPIMEKLGESFELRFTSGLRDLAGKKYPNNMTPLGRLSEEDLIKEYQECDALLFPSRFEGFGYVALEAMACGKPVVATDTTSIPEVVDNGFSGILCPTDDIGAFLAACQKLAADRGLCERMGKAGRKRALEVFSEEVIVSQYIDLYQSLLKA